MQPPSKTLHQHSHYHITSPLSPKLVKMIKPNHMSPLLLYYLSSFFHLSSSSLRMGAATSNPFTPKASVMRYWKTQISNDLPMPMPLFLINKASPLTAVESATFSRLADDPTALANQLRSFCSSADLLCFPDLTPTLENNVDSQPYTDSNFTHWGNHPVASRNYRSGNYAPNTIVADPEFTTNGKGVSAQSFGFKTYGTFNGYGKINFSFSKYVKESISSSMGMTTGRKGVDRYRWVEQGKFFRERMLKTGTVMPMPDIKDKMPKRSFLPRVISSKLPFSMSKIKEMKKIFHARENTSMASMIATAVSECDRAPSTSETKQCVGSVEDMIDFSVSVLGHNVVVRATENTEGSKNKIMIGKVSRINNGKASTSVSCHQSLFPYLLYYCHSVPKVRVYEADILDPGTKAKINHGVAICHVDTSSWSAGHGAFVALGFGPGKIEVCHWIFENDMIWAIAD